MGGKWCQEIAWEWVSNVFTGDEQFVVLEMLFRALTFEREHSARLYQATYKCDALIFLKSKCFPGSCKLPALFSATINV